MRSESHPVRFGPYAVPGGAQARALVPLGPRFAPVVQPKWRPAEVGGLFRDLRRLLRLSLPDVANRLRTRIDIIEALEAGDVKRLPPWPETVRIVSEYTRYGGIDPRPVLQFVREELRRHVATVESVPVNGGARRAIAGAHNSMRRAASSAASAARAVSNRLSDRAQTLRSDRAARGASRGRLWRSTKISKRLPLGLAVTLPLALLVSFGESRFFSSVAAALREPIAGAARDIGSFLGQAETRKLKDGLVWIEVDDPRSRRGDKLKTGRR